MNKRIKHNGSNHYSIPHMSKRKLERLGQLPVSIVAATSVFDGVNSGNDADDGDDSDENSEENSEN